MGSGISGLGSAILAKKQGWNAFVSDMGTIQDSTKIKLEKLGIPFEEKQHSLDKIANADLVMKSPGIPSDAKIIQELDQIGIPVVSEIDWASRFTQATLIGITTTNGSY